MPGLVRWRGWQAIDQHERALGAPQGRPRVKLVRLPQLLAAAVSALTSALSTDMI